MRGFHFAEWVVAAEVFEEFAYDAAGTFGLGELGCRGEEALFGVGGDLFDRLWDGFVGILALAAGYGVAGEVGAGDLEAVEEEAGAAGVEGVGGDGEQDLADGLQIGRAHV